MAQKETITPVEVDVAVIIPVRNGADFIGEALHSVCDQTARPREIIVVDDGSTDSTAEIVATFPDVIYQHQPSSGAAEARNAGARRATMPFLSFLDADDLWTPRKTELQLRTMLERPELEIVSGRMQQFHTSESGKVILQGEPLDSRLLTVLLVRREAFWRVGPLSSAWVLGETIDWWARAIDLNVCHAGLRALVYLRRQHSKNIGRTIDKPGGEYLKMLRAVIERRRRTTPTE
jgi:glycosyltransferase involved in cell wall biosynthesis